MKFSLPDIRLLTRTIVFRFFLLKYVSYRAIMTRCHVNFPIELLISPIQNVISLLEADKTGEGSSLIYSIVIWIINMYNDVLYCHLFKDILKFSLQYDFQENLKISLLPILLRNLEAVAKTPCGKVGHIFSKRVAQFLN